MRRKIEYKLLEWKNTKDKECLLVYGARQVGKTYSIREFGQKYYKTFVEINFMERPDLCNIFSGNLSAEEIYKRISIFFPNKNLVPGETLIFLDEIQNCANARTAEKFLAEDNQFDVISSGSLLGIELNDKDRFGNTAVIPVGYESSITMYSMDFEEYLWALGHEDNIEYIKSFANGKEKINNAINEKLESIVREYIVVGGMPAVVKKFVETKNFAQVQFEQDKIIKAYKQDIVKHAPQDEKVNIKNCYESIPNQLAKENKKFQYSKIESKATSKKYKYSIQWLSSASLINLCHNVETPVFPLTAYKREDYFKAYVSDTGLLVAMYGYDMKKQILLGSLIGNAKGAIYENFIAEILVKKGYELMYYKKDNSEQEIEFLITKDANIIPIEVKSKKGKTESLNNFIKMYEPPYSLKFIDGNSGVSESKITLPHYLAFFAV